MTHRTRRFFLPFLGLLVLFAQAGCTKSAAPEGLFVYVSLDEETAQDLLAAYRKETGNPVNFVRLSTGEASARLEAEKNNPQASLWMGGVGLFHSDAKDKGLTTPYLSSRAAGIPAEYRDPDHYWTGLYRGILAFAVNTQQLKKKNLTAPQVWNDLLDPKWKGLIQIPNPGTSGTSYNIITTLIARSNEHDAFEFLKALDKNISQYTRSGAAPGKNVALGETIAAVSYAQDILQLIHKSKAPLELIYPKDGTGFEIASLSLIKGGKHQEAAKKLVDWLYSKPATEIMMKHDLLPFVQNGVPVPAELRVPAGLKLYSPSMDWAGKNKQRLVDLWNETINS